MRAALVLTTLIVVTATSATFAPPARAEPSDRTLVLAGLAMAPPTYLLGVALHEGSHALAAKLAGADVLDIHLFPPGRDPKSKTFRFGWTYVRGLKSKSDRRFFYIAPKITDTLLLGGFAALVFTNAWPSNDYAQLALTVFGTGLWVDYAKDVIAFKKTNDVVRVFDLWCMRGWKQVAPRLLYAATAVGWGLVVARGYRRLFTDDATGTARTLPLLTASF
ncbi:MAG: M50 family metallopeptidase [Deltaproteobacteria bacterium]|nr:M50 family metallopeptidase [Deltaproteobacteria bacterium]